MNFLSQPEMVRGSLLMDEQRQHRHDAPARRTNSRSPSNGWPTDAGESVSDLPSSAAVSQGVRPEDLGAITRGAGRRTPPGTYLNDECGVCLLVSDRDGQFDLVEQATCPIHGFENHPAIRRIPGTRRAS